MQICFYVFRDFHSFLSSWSWHCWRNCQLQLNKNCNNLCCKVKVKVWVFRDYGDRNTTLHFSHALWSTGKTHSLFAILVPAACKLLIVAAARDAGAWRGPGAYGGGGGCQMAGHPPGISLGFAFRDPGVIVHVSLTHALWSIAYDVRMSWKWTNHPRIVYDQGK